MYIFYHLFSKKVTTLGTGAEKVREEKTVITDELCLFILIK